MPLETGTSKAAFGHNVATEMKAGKSQKQALAIAFAKKRGDGWRRKQGDLKRHRPDAGDCTLNDAEMCKLDAACARMDDLTRRCDAVETAQAAERVKADRETEKKPEPRFKPSGGLRRHFAGTPKDDGYHRRQGDIKHGKHRGDAEFPSYQEWYKNQGQKHRERLGLAHLGFDKAHELYLKEKKEHESKK